MIKHQHLGLLGALALAALSTQALAACNGGYRWTETVNGKTTVHYTQQPPEGRPSECVQVTTGTRTQVNPETEGQAQQTDSTNQPQAAAADQPKSFQTVPDKDPAKCKQAQDTLSALNSHARIREKAANGEYRYLSQDEIAEQKRLASDAVNIYCK